MPRPYTLPKNVTELRSAAARAYWGPKDNHGRFWAKVDKDGPVFGDQGPCWLWTGGRSKDGYGMVWRDGKMRYAHIVAWEEGHGAIPPGKELDHACPRRHCIRHVAPVSHAENLTRARGKPLDECIRGHSLLDSYRTAKGSRSCRACTRMRTAEYRARRRAERA